MTADISEPPAAAHPQGDLSLRQVALALAGPLVWAVHFMLGNLAAEGACRLNALGGPWLGLTGLGWFILIATLLAFGLSAWAGWHAFGRWRSLRAEPGRALRPSGLLALAGWSLSLIFTTLIALSLVSLVVLPPCAWL
jgi:hypothetical protein